MTSGEWEHWLRYDAKDPCLIGRGAVSWLEGGCPDVDRAELGAAAMCLNEHISWEMVDALRWAEEGYQPGDGMRESLKRSTIGVVADLLQSLLPPRDENG